MSFVEEDDIFTFCEGLLAKLFKDIMGISVKIPFPRLSYVDAMSRFGTDKPDMRLQVEELKDVTRLLKDCEFKIFRDTIKDKGSVIGFVARKCADFSRMKLDKLIKLAQDNGAKGLAYFKIEKDGINSPIQKFFKENQLNALKDQMNAGIGDLILLVADLKEIAQQVLGLLRGEVAKSRGLIDRDAFCMLWVIDFPLFKYNIEEKKWESEHHPFTSCRPQDIPLLEKRDFKNIYARSYDFVINGIEIASGSIRIHSRDLQEKIFDVIGLKREEARKRFGFLIDAFEYGAPPHGGIAFGLDRFITLFTKSLSIRDVIAFPKSQKAVCPLTGAPSQVDDAQLKELHIKKGK
jgi:aspartyl-tRNA synthetase